jgi:hypothetical protein
MPSFVFVIVIVALSVCKLLRLIYFTEVAPSARAVCTVTDHKKLGIKIPKGELRLGAWVAFGDNGSYKWRHW